MIEIIYSKKISKIIYEILKTDYVLFKEVTDKVTEFKNFENHQKLKVNKLHGKMKYIYSFSVNYKYRILFKYLDKNTIVLLTIGDHQIYQ
jgi:plasmid maintenance system killer protein